MSVVEVTVTAPSEWVEKHAPNLVRTRLVACLHASPIQSKYWWQGSLVDSQEIKLVMHTKAALVDLLLEEITGTHPYDVPCVIASEISWGNPDYLEWIVAETKSV